IAGNRQDGGCFTALAPQRAASRTVVSGSRFYNSGRSTYWLLSHSYTALFPTNHYPLSTIYQLTC
ncbi:hypothetical protein, partial [Chlorogloeopsis fritschii]|uniref:hypothetical protein n=1 Tax=Chlorogloeopsis fritschii TaxID=1124 RepID=UPI001F471163